MEKRLLPSVAPIKQVLWPQGLPLTVIVSGRATMVGDGESGDAVAATGEPVFWPFVTTAHCLSIKGSAFNSTSATSKRLSSVSRRVVGFISMLSTLAIPHQNR